MGFQMPIELHAGDFADSIDYFAQDVNFNDPMVDEVIMDMARVGLRGDTNQPSDLLNNPQTLRIIIDIQPNKINILFGLGYRFLGFGLFRAYLKLCRAAEASGVLTDRFYDLMPTSI